MVAFLAQKSIRMTLVLMGLSWLMNASIAFASGSYTSAGSRALADSNMSADSILAGDNKILLSRGSLSAAKTLTKKFPAEPSIVSGALLERKNSVDAPTVARICSETNSLLLTLFPDGRSSSQFTDLETLLQLKGPRDLRCAVDRKSGEWMAVNLRTGAGVLLTSAAVPQALTTSFNLPNLSSAWTHITAMSGVFFAFSKNGQSALIERGNDDTAQVHTSRSPWTNLDPHDTLASNGSFLLKAGQGQLLLTEIQNDVHNPEWSTPSKINVSPCADTGGCGAWIAADGRWIVAGVWGTYAGLGQQFSRLKTPLVVGDATTPGIAMVRVQGNESRYILVGDIDSDIGSFSATPFQLRFQSTETPANVESRGKHPRRFAVWLKGRVDELSQFYPVESEKPRPLFTYSANSSRSSMLGDVIIVEGRMPQKLPPHWAAVEPQVEFDAISMASEWTPARRAMSIQPPKQLWWSAALELQQALKELTRARISPLPVQIAVVDSGADLLHPALQNVFHINTAEIPDNGIDDDGNGLTDDVFGYDFVDEKSNPADQFGHGTHVTGLLRNIWSEQGLMGGSFNARLRILRALDAKGKSNSIDLSRAIAAAIQGRADILNCSWGGGPETQILRDAFAAAREAEILIFSSAGNDGLNSDVYPQVPKKFSGVFAIGASTEKQTRARFSNWGANSVFLFAPGADILSSLPDGLFGEKSGTSMASPIAASVASLVLGTVRSQHPLWSRSQQAAAVSDLLCSSAEKNRLASPSSKCGSLNGLMAIQAALRGPP